MRDGEGLIGRFVSILLLGVVVACTIAAIAYAEPATRSEAATAGGVGTEPRECRATSSPRLRSDAEPEAARCASAN